MKSIRTASFNGTSSNQKGNEETLLNEEMAGTIITVSKLGIIDKGRKKIYVSNSFASIVEPNPTDDNGNGCHFPFARSIGN